NNYFVIKDKNPTLPIKEILELAIQKTILQKQLKAQVTGSYFNLNVIDEKTMKGINDYVKRVTNPYKAYRIMTELMDLPKNVKAYTNKILKSTAKVIYYDTEDISAALILYFMIYGFTDYVMDYVIADEAQDMSYTQIYSLAMIVRKNNLLLAGDLAQSIIDPVYITDWIDLIETIKKYKDSNMKYSYHQLSKTYRTTVEIIDYVNSKIKNIFPKSYPLPEAVLRHGSEVNEFIIKKNFAQLNTNEQKDFISKLIDYSNNFSTIALITKDSNDAEDVYRILEKNKELKNRLISIDKEDYSSGIFVIPITKAKGLEFDCVYIMDFEEKILTDLHLTRQFYTGCTRALHQLNIIKVEK
ncbi:MAG TPA: 3'-5' exonuclease, partial [Candidatus Dojkabacteria bacterium]|nr:3'-5' exonuclease [Candidatus Dojkabacteria bacterium]